MSYPLSVSLFLCVCVFVSSCLRVSVSPCLHVPVSPSLRLSVSMCFCVFLSPSASFRLRSFFFVLLVYVLACLLNSSPYYTRTYLITYLLTYLLLYLIVPAGRGRAIGGYDGHLVARSANVSVFDDVG